MSNHHHPFLAAPHLWRRFILLISFSLLCIYTLASLAAPGKTALAAGTITGTVFQDFNADGVFNTTAASGIARDLHVAGVTVTAYDSSGTQRGQTTTVRCTAAAAPQSYCTAADTGPNYSLSATGTGPYRIEFTWDKTTGTLSGYEHSGHSTDSVNGGTATTSGSTAQFVSDGTTSNVNLALNRSCDYCQDNARLVATRFENGLRTGNTNGSIISMNQNPTSHNEDEQIQNTGAVWGVAYDGLRERIFTAAFLKRHVDLGPRGMDGVYVMDYSSATPTSLGGFDLQGVTAANGGAIDLGTVTRGVNANNTLGAATAANVDLDAFAKVGKTGYGDIDFGADNKSLWMVNLFQRTLIKVDTSQITISATNPNTLNSAAVSHFNIVTGGAAGATITGAPGCTAGNLRPFGLKIRETRGYLGVVCDAVTSTTRDNPPELIGYVLSFDVNSPSTFTTLVTVPFTYNREPYYQMKSTENRVDGQWQRWMDTWTDADINTPANPDCCANFRSAPSPILSDIEFMPDGSLILGVMDRFSQQSGWGNRKAIAGDTTTLTYGSVGDVLLAKYSGGAYTLETGETDPGDPSGNNFAGYSTTDSPGNAGEYFYGDAFTGSDATHGETTLGTAAYMPGTDRVFSPSYDPTAFFTQGLIWQPISPGSQLGAYAVETGTGLRAFGKANGMGDMEFLCNAAPFEIGNRVWRDTNGNGLQDPGEMPMAGVTVQLWADTNGDATVDTQVGTAVTDANGEYYFGGVNTTNMLSLGSPASFSTRVSANSDDAEQTGSSVDTDDDTIDLPWNGSTAQLDGFRFQNITIPQGATITSATIQFTSTNTRTATTVNIIIRGQDADDAATFTTGTNNISGRTTTTASTSWSNIGSWATDSTTNATTPDLAAIVQEIVDRGGWSSGNDMAFILSNNSSTAGAERDITSHDNNAAAAALLTINYTTSSLYTIAPTTAYQVRIDPTVGSNSNLLNGLAVTTQNAAQPANGNAAATTNNSITDVADSDAATSGANYVANLTTGNSGANNLSFDFGFAPLGSIGNRVWLDEDSNGIQDEGEDGLPNVRVYIDADNDGVLDVGESRLYTDANGNYLFKDLPAGTYRIRVDSSTLTSGLTQTTVYDATGSDFLNQQQGYTISLGTGKDNLTADFGYNWNSTSDVTTGGATNTTAALGDRVWIDNDGDGHQDAGEVGVGGAVVTIYGAPGVDNTWGTADDVPYTTGGYVSTRTTDANGNYMFDSLPPGQYSVRVTSSASASHAVLTGGTFTQTGDPEHWGTTGTNNDNQTTTPVILGPGDVFLNADFGYRPVTSTNFGRIGNFVWLDLDVDGIGPNSAGQVQGKGGTADANEVGIGGVSVALIRNTDGDSTWDAGEPIIATAFTSDGTQDVDGDGTIDPVGYYRFINLQITDGTGSDDYIVVVTDVNNVLDGLRQTYDGNDTNFPTTAITTPNTSFETDLGTTEQTDDDFGYTPDNSGEFASRTTLSLTANTGTIGNYVWFDLDGDGVGPNGNGNAGSDNNEVGIPNVRVNLYDSTGTTLIATTLTGNDGYYLFPNLTAGGTSYVVRVDTSTLPGGAGAWDQTYDANGTGTANQSTEASLTDGEVNLTHDFGYRGQDDGGGTNRGSIGNLVWLDTNADGNVDNFGTDETAISGVTVDLYWDTDRDGRLDADEPRIATTTTDASGAYLFSGLAVTDGVNGDARYVVDVSDRAGVLSGYWHSLGSQSAANDNESKADPYAVTLAPTNSGTRNVLTVDFGYYPRFASVGNFVFKDINGDGIQDRDGVDNTLGNSDDEVGINGVVVRLVITYPGTNGVVGTGGDDTTTTITTITGDDPSTTGTTELGWYSFANLLQDENYNGVGAGEPTYTISVVTAENTGVLANLFQTITDQGGNDLSDSDNHAGVSATATKGSNTVTQTNPATSEQTIASYDFGYSGPVNIGNFVWWDKNNDGDVDANGDDGNAGTPNDNEAGIDGVDVQLWRDSNFNGTYESGTDTLVTTVTTAGGGAYNFTNQRPGNYFVVIPAAELNAGGTLAGYFPSTAVVTGNSDTNNSNHGTSSGTIGSGGIVLTSGVVTVSSGGEPSTDGDGTSGNLTIDFGFYQVVNLGNQIWFDVDNDGLYEPNGNDGNAGTPADNEVGISGVEVQAYRDDGDGTFEPGADDTLQGTTTTNSSGVYSFANLPPGRYFVRVTNDNFMTGGSTNVLIGYQNSTSTVSGNSDTNSSDHGRVVGTLGQSGGYVVTQNTAGDNAGVVTLVNSSEPDTAADTDGTNGNLTADFGFYRLQLTGTVFTDNVGAANGTLDAGETSNAALTGLTVRLYLDANDDDIPDGAAIATTTTAAGGGYSFDNLSSARYIVGVVQPTGWHSTIDTASQSDNDDPVSGVNDNDNGRGNGYGEVRSRSYNLVAGGATGNNVVTFSTGTTSNDRLDFGISQSPTAAELGTVTAQVNDDNTVTVTWETLNEITVVSFDIQRSGKDGVFTAVNTEVIPALSLGTNTGNTYTYTDTNVAAKGTYAYRVQLARVDTSTFESESVTVKVQGNNACAKKPDAPLLLTPERDAKVKTGKVEFTWQAVDCAKTYQIEIRADSADGAEVASKKVKDANFSIKKLDAGRTYYWRVSACNAKDKCAAGEWVAFQMKREKDKAKTKN